ncbi:hypothetical protein [Desulfitobacterium metallireducens]|uniref:Uncharacterized protein n=1 Tax=Desulfitobacterium metallireducens DSM 15288 TaxID=871968 RepID=W0EDI7_9FIRM|nr:hypothetical protein [Desulfitobacterium metallireducens]AHF07593.1 hypothetical protein DESME_11665 [Desulfitobacterium metallireducens DSM 15288]
MPFKEETKKEIYEYCNNHLADEAWYQHEFDFIANEKLRDRLVAEFRAIRFAYKLYEGIEAQDENYLFEIRCQILSYATLYEAVIDYVLYTYYSDSIEFDEMTHHTIPVKIDIPKEKREKLEKELCHNGKQLSAFYYDRKEKEGTSIRFDSKCKTAEKLGLIHTFQNENSEQINLTEEIITIYSYRNGIHIIAEQRKGIQYELDLSKKAYRRMRPFIDQVKQQLTKDGKLAT